MRLALVGLFSTLSSSRIVVADARLHLPQMTMATGMNTSPMEKVGPSQHDVGCDGICTRCHNLPSADRSIFQEHLQGLSEKDSKGSGL